MLHTIFLYQSVQYCSHSPTVICLYVLLSLLDFQHFVNIFYTYSIIVDMLLYQRLRRCNAMSALDSQHFVDIFHMYSICFITISMHQRLRGYNTVSLLDFQYCINIFLYIHFCIVISNVYHCLYLEIYTSSYTIYHQFVYIVHMFCL